MAGLAPTRALELCAQPVFLEGLFIGYGRRRKLGDVRRLVVVEATAQGESRGDGRKSNDDAHD